MNGFSVRLPDNFSEIRRRATMRLLRLYYEAHSGHIGGSLSCLDSLLVIYHAVLSDADRFILSKGHAAGALYTVLWSRDLITEERLATFNKEGTTLPGHPSGSDIPGLLFPTGSLGHGPSLCSGMAIALKHKKEQGKVYCLCSDGEWQEGACWEALQFSVHRNLDNLVILIDQNGLQAFGTTEEVMGTADLTSRFAGFGASVVSVDGHNPEAILRALSGPPGLGPSFIILRTRKGLGLHFEGKIESHYLPLTREQYEKGVQRLHNGGMI
jgi:transketolase